MTIHLKIVLPAAPWTRSMTGLPQVRQPWGKVNAYVRSPVRIRKSSMFLRTRAQFFHSNIRITTRKGPPPYRGGVVCVFQWPVELCRLGLWLLVGPHMPKRSKDRDQPKSGLLVLPPPHPSPPPPPPTWTCWARHIKSVDGFVFFRLCYFCGRFFGYISWQMLKIAFWSFQILKFSREDTPIPPYKARAFGTRDNVPPSPFPPLLQRI